jgi:hypothetical protein
VVPPDGDEAVPEFQENAMTLEQTPAPARSDVVTGRAGGTDPLADPSTRRRPFVVHGTVLTAGALAWGVTQVVNGIDPHGATEEAIYSLTSGVFQVGLLCLLHVLGRTHALGTGRLARSVLRLETAVVVLAMGSTAADGVGVSDLDRVAWLLLDLTWPLSMLGMFAIGIRIAIAGRWHGPARFWPVLAESWAVVCIPTMGVFGAGVAGIVSLLHLTLGYGVLGQIVARKQA